MRWKVSMISEFQSKLIKKGLFLNKPMKFKKYLNRKTIFLLPLIGVGFLFNSNPSLANLKDLIK